MDNDIPTPECDKMIKVKDHSQAIGEFLDWAGSKGLALCYYNEQYERWYIQSNSIERLLADYFNIDLNKVEAEKRAILNAIRNGSCQP